MTNLSPTTRRPEPGFSLIELLVVITIIAIISGLILGGVSHLKEDAKVHQAQALLANLMGNAGMYETKTEYPVVHHRNLPGSMIQWNDTKNWNAPGSDPANKEIIKGEYINVENDENPSYTSGRDNNFYMRQANLYIERFVWAANQLPQIRDSLPSLGSAFEDADGDGFMEVIDPWGNPIAYANNVSHNDPVTDDDFLPAYSKAFFASAGKDQKWGRARKSGEMTAAQWATYKDTDDYKDSVDNLYSFDMDRSAATRGD